MSYFFIFLFTFFIATRKDIIYNNITGVSTIPEYHFLVMIYTIICAIFFAYQTYRHFHYLYHYPLYIPFLIVLATLSMCIGSICPYTNTPTWLSSIHVYASMSASILFILLLQIYTHELSLQFPNVYLQTHWIFHVGLQVLVLLFLVSGAITGMIEILYVFFICLYLYAIDRQMKKVSHMTYSVKQFWNKNH